MKTLAAGLLLLVSGCLFAPSPTSDAGAGQGGNGPASDPDCIARPALAALGSSHFLVGAQLENAQAMSASIDARYLYLAGGIFDGASVCGSCTSNCSANGVSCADGGCDWWGCWQDPSAAPGGYVRDLLAATQQAGQIPMVTYYELLQSSGVDDGLAEVDQVQRPELMTRYFADFRFVLQLIGDRKAMIHIEPDFWGYAEYTGKGPHQIPAAVASANSQDCAGFENSVAGMGRCLIAMVRKYAPHALVGLHASAWSTTVDATENSDETVDVAAQAAQTVAFLKECGAADADFIGVETSDRDAGYYQIVEHTNHWWDATNQSLPNFHQAFSWAKAISEGLLRPNLFWQTPLGNLSLNNTAQHYQDNRVDYFFGHLDELIAAHSLGMFFGAGAGDQTNPATDGGNMLNQAKAYAQSGGQAVCTQ